MNGVDEMGGAWWPIGWLSLVSYDGFIYSFSNFMLSLSDFISALFVFSIVVIYM